MKVGEVPREPTQGRLTVSPSVTVMLMGGAKMMTSMSPSEVPDENSWHKSVVKQAMQCADVYRERGRSVVFTSIMTLL